MRVSISAKNFAVMLTAGGLLALPVAARAQCAPPVQPGPALHDSLVVSTAWLGQHLHDPDVVVVHVDHMEDTYTAGHIPGARHADAMDFAVGDHDLPPAAVLDSLAETLGISNTSRVVLYGDPWATGWMYLVMDLLGMGERTALLDGGFPQWHAEHRPVATERPPVARGHLAPDVPRGIVVDASWLHDRLENDRLAVVDARSPEEYAGTAHESLPRTGHIPGARLLTWSTTFTDPDGAEHGRASRLLSPTRLRALLAAAGVRTSDVPVTYCTVGLRAAHLYFVLRYLGYRPKFYDGSMSDWSRRSELPLVTGTARGTP